jgi:hypothetical protein
MQERRLNLKHCANKSFWKLYKALSPELQKQACKQYTLLKANPQYPSVRFKPVGKLLWSARVNDNYRALAIKRKDAYVWFWIGLHDEYERILS